MSKWLIAVGCVVIILLVMVVVVASNNSKSTDATSAVDAPLEQPVDLSAEKSSTSKPVIAPAPIIAEPSTEESQPSLPDVEAPVNDTQKTLEQAMQSMGDSLDQQDPRTPEMSEPYQRELPTAEELADPVLYEAYELRQTKKMAAVYSSVAPPSAVAVMTSSAGRQWPLYSCTDAP